MIDPALVESPSSGLEYTDELKTRGARLRGYVTVPFDPPMVVFGDMNGNIHEQRVPSPDTTTDATSTTSKRRPRSRKDKIKGIQNRERLKH